MVDVKELYPEEKYTYNGEYCRISDYNPMLDAFGNVVVRVDTDSYQGDTYILYDNGDKIGHLIFGWGSCSGCDTLQRCESIEEVQELCDHLENSIKWFDSNEEALKWIITHDWFGDYLCYQDETYEYIGRAIIYLRGEKLNAYY